MSKGLERLKEIGAQKIYEETHIPIQHVQAIIHESFDGFSRVQFLGFVSILEREYNQDLSDLRLRGLEEFEPFKDTLGSDSVFISVKKKKGLSFVYILLALLIVGGAAYMKLNSSSDSEQTPQEQALPVVSVEINESNESTIVQTQSDINLTQNETNSTLDINATLKEEPAVPSVLKFYSKSKLWIGYIDVSTNKHYNKTFSGEFELDAKKSWLLVFGHKFADIVIDERRIEVNKEDSLRFLYEDGEITPLTMQEFKRLNRGRAW